MNAKFGALEHKIGELVDRGQLVDAQYAIAQRGQVVACGAFGAAALDSRFCIFSSTKPVFASLIWRLIDDGRLTLDTAVADLWPEFGQHGKDAITLEQLLLFTSGIPNGMIPREALGSRETRAAVMEQWELEWKPGSQYQYHPLSAGWVLSEVVSLVTGLPHGVALRELVLDPLSIDRLDLGVAHPEGDVRPVTYIRDAPFDPFAALTGEPAEHDDAETAEIFDVEAFASDPVLVGAGAPGGGAISDAASVAQFYQALLHNPGGLWSPAILADATTNIRNRMPDPLRLGAPANRTIGLIVADGDHPRLTIPEHGIDLEMHPFGPAVPPGTFGHGGGGGQIALADPTTGVSFCFLSNAIDRDAFGAFQNQQDIIAAAFEGIT